MDINRALIEEAVRKRSNEVLLDEESLMHFASAYYDPAKAKEYYERTKKLKGRDPAMTKGQKEVYNVSKSNMSAAKTKDSDKAKSDQAARIEGIRTRAVESAKKIEAKMAQISEALNAKVEALTKANEALPLNEIPPNATPKQREFLEKQNRQIKAGNADKTNKLIKGQAQAAADSHKAAQAQRKVIGDGMRSELKKAREGYKVQMDTIKTKYTTADTKEQTNIRTRVK